MSSPHAGAATSDNVVDNNGSFDPELARAYSSMPPHEFKDNWYLESTMKKDPTSEEDGYLSAEDDKHFIEVWTSVSPSICITPTTNNNSEGDNSMVHLDRSSTPDTAMISSGTSEEVNENTATTHEAVNENDASASSSSPKKNPPVRRLRPRRENQVKPYTWELALHKAKIAGIEELLAADARLRREEEKHSLEDQYEEEENDHQDDEDDDDDDDPMDTEDDDDDESEERIVRKGLRHMRLSEKKRHTSSPSLSTSSPSLPSTPPPIDPLRSSVHVSLWPTHTTNTRAPTVSRVYGSKKKKHRMTRPMKSKIQSSRRRAPRIMEDDEEEDEDDDNMENDDIQQPEPEVEDVFAFPQHPIQSPFPNATRQSGKDDDVDDIFDFPIDAEPVDPIDDDPVDDSTPTTPRPRSTHQAAMDELKRRRQGRQRATSNDDEFVVEDTEEFKPKKRKRFNMNELPSTHGVLPRSFGIVAKRLEERPKPVAQMDDEEDNDAHSTTSSASSSASADELPMYDPTLKQQLLPEFFESPPQSHSASHSSSSPRQPSKSSSSRPRTTNTNHSSSNKIRYSSSKMPRSSNSTAQGSSNHHPQQPSKKRRRRQRNKLDGIYIHPRLDDDYLPSLPKFGRGDPSRSHIPYLPSDDDMDDMELDTNTNSRSSAQLTTSTAFNSPPPPSASHPPFQHSLLQPSSPALSFPSTTTPIQDPFEEFVKSHPTFTYDFNTTPSHYEGSISGTRYIGRGFLANLFEQEQPLAMPATQVFGEELPMMDSSSSSDDDNMAPPPAWMDYASLQRLLYKCFHHLANYIERDIGGREQEIELRKFTCIYHFLSWSIMVQGRALPGYFEKEIECMVQRVLTLNGKRTPSKWVILILVYYMDWKRRLHPSLNDSRAQHLLLEHLYRLGPDQVHIQVNEASITAENIVSVEAWVSLLKFEADHGQIWHTLWTWIEQDESLPVWDKVERAWHWLFVIRVMRGFDTRGKLSKPSFHDQSTWPGVSRLVTLSRELVEKWGTKYDQYAHCLRKRWRSLNTSS